MADAPPAHAGKGAAGFLSKETAGLPNWAWIVVIGAGIAAVYVVPKLMGQSTSSSSTSGTSGDTSGLGLAIDPTTGLPYAVEGLVPAGGTAGSTGGLMMTDTGGTAPGALTGSPASTYTTKGGETFSSLANSNFSSTQIQQLALATYPYLASYGNQQPLPSGLQLITGPGNVQVGSGASFAQVTPTTPAWPGGTTQLRVG